ncbi:MAG: hypothetical protein EOP49_23490 [Sphingobacteriales bacterium]|nr:MAG: hypothetical protein EOP49_23490 [Sphingobacteriales bacterium]
MHNVSKGTVPLQAELDLVEHYLRLEQLRYDHSFRFIIDVGEQVETDFVLVPPLFIQPIVENALKHGFLQSGQRDNLLQIRVVQDEQETVTIEIEDNGRGFPENEETGRHESFGLKNIRQRISQLAMMNDQKIDFDIIRLRTEQLAGSGTIVSVKLHHTATLNPKSDWQFAR